MAAAAASRKTAVRIDPEPRPVDAEATLGQLVNTHPDYEYRLAYMVGHDINSYWYYTRTGWEPCVTPQPGETGCDFSLGSSSQPGEPLEQMGCRAVRMLKTKFAARDADGQRRADEVEKSIIKRRSVPDGSRGIPGYLHVKNKTRTEMSILRDEALGDIPISDD